MEVRADVPVSVGYFVWPHRPSTATLVVKMTFVPGERGEARVAASAVPVTLERYDARGELLEPSDFAPYKPGCDVVLIGSALKAPARWARLTCGTIDKQVDRVAALGPTALPGANGDPSDRRVAAMWKNPGFDFSRFHCAPIDQRMAWSSGPTSLSIQLDALRFALVLTEAPVIHLETRSRAQKVDVRADALIVDSARGRCSVTYRGFVEGADESARVVVASRADTVAAVFSTGGTFFGRAVTPEELQPKDEEPEAVGSSTVALTGLPEGVRVVATTLPFKAATMAEARAAMKGLTETTRLAQGAVSLDDEPTFGGTPDEEPFDVRPEDVESLDDAEPILEPIAEPITGPVDDPTTGVSDDDDLDAPTPKPTLTMAAVTDDIPLESEGPPTDRPPPTEPPPPMGPPAATLPPPPKPRAPEPQEITALVEVEAIRGRRKAMTTKLDDDEVAGRVAPLPFQSNRKSEGRKTQPPPAPSEGLPFKQRAPVPFPPPSTAGLPFAGAQAKPRSSRRGGAGLPFNQDLPKMGRFPEAPDLPSTRPLTPPDPSSQIVTAKAGRATKNRELELETVTAIKRAIYAAPEKRREILAGFGLTALEWRLAERAMLRDLGTARIPSDRVRKLMGSP